MDYDEEQVEEKSFKVGSNDDESLYDDGDPLDIEDDSELDLKEEETY